MRNSILRMVTAMAVLLASGTAFAGRGGGHERGDYRPSPVPHKVPEIPATGLAAGLIVVVGGVAIALGRRRRSQ
jgi:hypothetical protein